MSEHPEDHRHEEKVPAQPPAPMSPEDKHALDLKTERDARHQARVGQTVRGDGS